MSRVNRLSRVCLYYSGFIAVFSFFNLRSLFRQGINQKSRGINVEFWNSNEINQSRTTNSTVYFPGAAGLVLARELLKSGSETNVCIFEKENRLGGKILDYRFPEAPNITVGKFPRQFLLLTLHLYDL